MNSTIEVKSDSFYINNKPFRILSGAIHYFRIHPIQWRDRLEKLKACGLNTVETYIPWNVHETEQGVFNFSGMANVEEFVRLAQELGLFVIVRPGPYICSEWDFGGLPAWLMNVPDLRIRCSNAPFLSFMGKYFNVLLPKLAALQITQNGPIIAIQVENEYGAYANDKKYLSAISRMYDAAGITIPKVTSDWGIDCCLESGMADGALTTINFAVDPDNGFNKLLEHQPDQPLMCTEFWSGQGMKWGMAHRLRDTRNVSRHFEQMLARGANVSIYMFHGGTNFGFMNGASNHDYSDGTYVPFITSYDTDAILNEAGDPTDKFYEFRRILGKYNTAVDPALPTPAPSPKRAYGCIELEEQAILLENLPGLCPSPVTSPTPECMERFGQNYGFILYRTHITGPKTNQKVGILKPHDRAHVFINGNFRTVVNRNDKTFDFQADFPNQDNVLDILVENMGRVNFGINMEYDRKGITKGVVINGLHYQHGWDIYNLPLTDITGINYERSCRKLSSPTFYRGHLQIDDMPQDSFIKIPHGTKGICWVNGFNLGRYWNAKGPQFTLYVPAPLLRNGTNVIEILELDRMDHALVAFTDKPEV